MRGTVTAAVASDHAGFPLKARIIEELRKLGHETVDLGTGSADPVDWGVISSTSECRRIRTPSCPAMPTALGGDQSRFHRIHSGFSSNSTHRDRLDP
jgi:hypothetical protein